MPTDNALDNNDRLLQGQMEFLARAAAGSCVFTFLLTVLLAAGLWKHTPMIINGCWTAAMIVLTGCRYLHARSFLRGPMDPAGTRRFQQRFTLGVLASGFGWGCAAIFLFPFGSVPHQSFLSFALAGTTASAITLYAPLKWGLRAYLGLTLVPLAAVHFSQADEAHIAMGALVVIYIGLMFRFVALANTTLVNSLELRNENTNLIAELQAAKAQSDRVNQQLKTEVSQRRESENNLIEARDRAEQGARAKSEFLATMSHEIRTPMNGVLGMTELLLATELTNKQHKFVDTIRRSGSALLAIINDILDYSKIEAGKLELESSAFDLRQLVEDTMVFFAEQAQRKKVELVTNFPPDHHAAYRGDPERVRQVLMNLLGNAVKFTSNGEISLSVETVLENNDDATLRIAVADTGIGIKPEHQAHIFQSFQQADGSTTRKFGGTGLGLAICNRLVQLMGGTIQVESEPNIGSTFSFTLDLKKLPAAALPRNTAVDHDLAALQVLIVDSNDTSREVLKQQLQTWGVKVYAANTGKFAVKYLHKSVTIRKPFDAVIFDNTLTDIEGTQFARKLRKIAEFRDVRLIMLSTMDMLEQTGQWLSVGIDNYISKPVRQAELREILGTAVRDDGSGQPQRAAATEKAAQLGAHVLLAEDNPVNQELARAMLESLGCSVVQVEDGQAAFDAISASPLDAIQRPYDVILMDCQMPVLDGFAATRRIREWESRQDDVTPVPIIALTANALQGDRDRCIAAGMNDYVSKPFSQDQLAAAISDWLTVESVARQRARETSSSGPVPAPPSIASVATAAEADATDSLLDQRALDNIRALQQPGQPDVLQKIIAMYRDSAPRLVDGLRAAINAGDADALATAAHTLKSSSANLGAGELAERCQELESCGRDNRIDAARALLDIVDYEFESVLTALAALSSDRAA